MKILIAFLLTMFMMILSLIFSDGDKERAVFLLAVFILFRIIYLDLKEDDK